MKHNILIQTICMWQNEKIQAKCLLCDKISLSIHELEPVIYYTLILLQECLEIPLPVRPSAKMGPKMGIWINRRIWYYH